MTVGTLELHLHTPWIHSLQEKRLLTKHIIERIHHRFPVCASEVDSFHEPHMVVLGIACVAGYPGMEQTVLDRVYQYIQTNTDAEFVDVIRRTLTT